MDNKNFEEINAERAKSDALFEAKALEENSWHSADKPELRGIDIAERSGKREEELRGAYAKLVSGIDIEISTIKNARYPGEEGEKALKTILNLKLLDKNFAISSEVMSRLTTVFRDASRAREDSGSSWSHSLCHLFEQYGEEDGLSFLNTSDTVSYGKELIEEALRRDGDEAINPKGLGSLSRIIGPVVKYNLEHLPDDVNARFVLYPEVEPAVLQKVIPHLRPELAVFLKSSDPKELVKYFLENKPGELVSAGAKLTPYLRVIEQQMGPEEAAKLIPESLRTDNGITSLEDLARNIGIASEHQEPAPEGLYVDVDGTLIVNGKLNESTMRQIEENEKGLPVVIFSGGNPENQTDRLRTLGFPEKYLPVVAKDQFRGKRLQGVLIDDTPPEYQGFSADEYTPPRRGGKSS